VRFLKSREKSGDIPVQLMSSKDDVELCAIGAACGADASLPKPVTPLEPVASVQNLLKQRLGEEQQAA
jgi:DNA-binding response OmpR family regulator